MLFHLFLFFLFHPVLSTHEQVPVDVFPPPPLPPPSLPPPCSPVCRFRFCTPDAILPRSPPLLLNGPFSASPPFICLPPSKTSTTSIGTIVSVGQALIATANNSLQPLSLWRPRGLRVPFVPQYLSVGRVPYLPRSSVTRAKTRRAQLGFLNAQCVVLPVDTFQAVDKRKGLDVGPAVQLNGKDNCVSFRTLTPAILVQLDWDSTDDFDVSVTEPGGATVDFLHGNSQHGVLLSDFAGECNKKGTGKEEIVYYDGVESGNYTVRVTHFKKCDGGAGTKRGGTLWRLRVVVDSVSVSMQFGMSDLGERKVVHAVKFEVE